MGFQGTNLGLAIDQVNEMLSWRQSDEPEPEDHDPKIDRSKIKCTIFLGYTSNMVSCGNREVIRYLCEHNMISAITDGSIGDMIYFHSYQNPGLIVDVVED